MESIYTEKFTVTPEQTDPLGRAKASSLLYFAQEAAGGHCRLLGVDWQSLGKRGLFWAVLRYRVQVTRLPRLGQTVTVETWPMPTTRSAFPRSTVARDENGNELFRIIGLWVLMDRESRTMVLPGKSDLELPGILRGDELPTPPSILPGEPEHGLRRSVTAGDLDRNGHMNNTRYMNWVDGLLPADYHRAHQMAEFSICYLSEARENEVMDLRWKLTDDDVLQVDAHRKRTDVAPGKDRVFSARVVYTDSVM